MSEVRKLTEADFDEWHALRLRGIRESPAAFWSSVEEDADPAPLLCRFQGQRGDRGGWILGAFSDAGQMVGCAGYYRMPHAKRRHIGGIWGVYVVEEARGARLSQRLLADAIERARRIDGLERLELGVIMDSVVVIKVYEHCGFVTYGREPAAIKVDGADHDEFLMSLSLLEA